MNLSPEQQREQLITIKNSLVMQNDIMVLIVDDDSDDADSAKSKLETFGIHAAVAESGDVAIQMIQSDEFRLCLLDWKLIGKTGLETLKEIKESAPRCTVVVLTGAADDEHASQALKFGALAVMLKPLKNEDIKFIFGKPTT